MTVSASIPAAVMSMLILRGLRLKDVTILENNSVQTMASAGESLAAGIIFTVPALLVIGIWTEILWLETVRSPYLADCLEQCLRSLCVDYSLLKKLYLP